MQQVFGFLRRTLFFLALVAVLSACATATAENAEQTDHFLVKFLGEWRSDGDAFGSPAESKMIWGFTLGARFVQLDYQVLIKKEPSLVNVFQGVGYYKNSDTDEFAAFWADNSGDLHPIIAYREGDALISNWGVEGGKQGRTRYELLGVELMEVTDWIKTGDGWRQFNQNTFERISAPPPKKPRSDH